METLNKIRIPARVIAISKTTAPAPVINAETPSLAAAPNDPELVRVVTERKKSKVPITTFGLPKIIFMRLKANPREIKMKGRKTEDQPKYPVKKSFTRTSTLPCLEKETKISPAAAQKDNWIKDKITFGLNEAPPLVFLCAIFFLFLLMVHSQYIKEGNGARSCKT